jgi:hypothetical protein
MGGFGRHGQLNSQEGIGRKGLKWNLSLRSLVRYEYIHLLSYNVCGLNNTQVICKLSKHVHSISPKNDDMLLQEHKLRGDKTNNRGQILWREVSNWTIEASLGYCINDPNSRTRKG